MHILFEGEVCKIKVSKFVSGKILKYWDLLCELRLKMGIVEWTFQCHCMILKDCFYISSRMLWYSENVKEWLDLHEDVNGCAMIKCNPTNFHTYNFLHFSSFQIFSRILISFFRISDFCIESWWVLTCSCKWDSKLSTKIAKISKSWIFVGLE